MKIDLKKSGGGFLSVNTFPPKQTPFLLDISVLVAHLLDHAGISPQQGAIIIVTNAPVDERIGHWNVLKNAILKS